MSFSKTISVCAALTTIFLAAGTGYKLSQENQSTTPQLEEKVQQLEKQLEKQLEETKQPQVAPEPVKLPPPTVQTVVPQPVILPPVTPPPPVPENVTP